MTLIERLRASTENTSTKLLLGLAIVLFIGVGGKRARGIAGGVVATVNGESISTASFQKALRAAMRQKEAGISDAERDATANETLDALVRQRLLIQEAERLGIAVDDAEVARYTKKIKAFQVDGEFDEKAFESGLDAMGYTPTEFRIEIRDMLLLEKLLDLAGRGGVVTEAEVRAQWEKAETALDLSFLRLTPEAFYGDIAVADADRDAFAAANADKIKAKYDEDYHRLYNLPKRYRLKTILLAADAEGVDRSAVKARAEALRAELVAGRDFAETARSESADPTAADGGDMGVIAGSALDPALAAAADKAGAGQLTEVAETPRGFHILHVTAIEDAKVVALDAARNDVAVQLLREEKIDAYLKEYAGRLIEQWSSTGTIPTAELEAHHVRLDSTGSFSLLTTDIPKLGPNAEILGSLSGRKPGDVLPVPIAVKGAVVVVQLASRTEPDPSAYATSGTSARAFLEMERRAGFIQAWQQELEKRAVIEKESLN